MIFGAILGTIAIGLEEWRQLVSKRLDMTARQ
jgi:hypothetical protein